MTAYNYNTAVMTSCNPGVQDPTSYLVILPAVSSAGRPTSLLSDYDAARASDAYSERMGPGV
ncbi:hypothetical protein A2U01_0051965 [Trifolium medium]|uniref:Uncharacterized protein n=1 Tax=Trifolium medium TaxID=97028 RepID=A0A392R3S5_9FABA|nr:hypothetical protein [Trifolium medium]